MQQAAFGGNNSAGGGPTFADVLSSSYGLTLNEFGGGADSEDAGGATPSHHGSTHMTMPSQCPESNSYRQNGSGRSHYHSHSLHGSGSPFSEALDTFHAEFITQPIDYPLSNVSPPPPLPIQHQQSTTGNTSDSTGSPVSSSQAPPTHPPMSPSLPSFLDTYRHPSGHEMSPQVLKSILFNEYWGDF